MEYGIVINFNGIANKGIWNKNGILEKIKK